MAALTELGIALAGAGLAALVLRAWERRSRAAPDPLAWDWDHVEAATWLCGCGNFVENEFDCPACGGEPPWGCPDEACERHRIRPRGVAGDSAHEWEC